jgi:hypothetical protein
VFYRPADEKKNLADVIRIRRAGGGDNGDMVAQFPDGAGDVPEPDE